MKWLIFTVIMGGISFMITAYCIVLQNKIADISFKNEALKFENQQDNQKRQILIEKQNQINKSRQICLSDAEEKFHLMWQHQHDTLYSWHKKNSLPTDVANITYNVYFSWKQECQLSFDNKMKMLVK